MPKTLILFFVLGFLGVRLEAQSCFCDAVSLSQKEQHCHGEKRLPEPCPCRGEVGGDCQGVHRFEHFDNSLNKTSPVPLAIEWVVFESVVINFMEPVPLRTTMPITSHPPSFVWFQKFLI